ncbi:hypothetical protein LJC68_07720 [Bacteroidales bacterium OttesenSCG-928-B11]|nr:hypothetical protein [Bacteroidales bacterium OttesenSCG-928-E04]MDL2308961.1 hypothetical protein [Bacteroidales bacterium OttesenSCG-928-C03]MDL2312747.1 hypothetical protein [Bacteroidales bacterium OttesenSCG-928-B11]
MFIDDILNYRSLSIVGMEKNTGKTEALNYVIRQLDRRGKTAAVTSIGIDGENVDLVTHTHKPEIKLPENTIFITSEKHYKQRMLSSEILDISNRRTALGRLVTARVKMPGKVILSGPPTATWLKENIQQLQRYNPDITIVDGALSRKSLGSPAVTDCMILTTGAALSTHLPELISKTKYITQLINIEEYETKNTDYLLNLENGIYAIGGDGEIHDLKIPSSLLLEQYHDRLYAYGSTIYVAGIVTGKVLELLRVQKEIADTTLVVKDFSKIYASKENVRAFLKKGGKISVLLKTRLIAVCINPLSPSGYLMDSDLLKLELEKALDIPVYDIKK